MRFAWLGFHMEGIPALEALLAAGTPVHGVLTLTPELAAKRSGAAEYAPVCRAHGVPLHYIADVNAPEAQGILRDLEPDVVFVIGWHQIVRPATLRLARRGMVGAHASLLPHNRGSAPVNWALIRGECETGNTLIWLAEDVDAGDIIDQAAFPITPYDTCATLYQRVAASNRDMLLQLLPRLLAGERPGRPQPRTGEPVLPRRRPADGLIDWGRPGRAVYDFIRALTRPYPGAFGALNGRRWYVWRAGLLSPDGPGPRAEPGEILGPVLSPSSQACGQMVACGEGTLAVLEVEAEDGTVLQGPALAEQTWTGKRWCNE
ncbi:MAG: methionyl-tRNA formyltransferase [Gemmatimonadetes bacterium]|nr:methionyl-tRNA formyltransferase [Gemmatimonadota bacterium]